MEFETVQTRLLPLCKEHEVFNLENPEASLDVDLMEAEAIDSMAVAGLTAMVSEEFGVVIPPEVMAIELRTLRDLIQYIADNAL